MHRNERHRYSVTSSARPSSVIGTASPNASAVLRLRNSSILIDCRTGSSAGFCQCSHRPDGWPAQAGDGAPQPGPQLAASRVVNLPHERRKRRERSASVDPTHEAAENGRRGNGLEDCGQRSRAPAHYAGGCGLAHHAIIAATTARTAGGAGGASGGVQISHSDERACG